jgi:hypothetical protein
MQTWHKHKALVIAVYIAMAVVLLFGTLSLLHPFRQGVRITAQTVIAHLYGEPTQPFPAVNLQDLLPAQKQIVALSRAEYGKKPVSFDATVLKYSQNAKESWCADYVSWIMKQAGLPFSNPNSGSWRIPGVNTLQEYFQDQLRYEKAGTYVPKVGDVAIYLDGRSHTNIVIAIHGNTMTTIGGNETGHLRLNTQKFTYGAEGLSGFGNINIPHPVL